MNELPLRWGILGTARIARNRFVRGVRAGTESEVLAIASRDLARARATANELGIPRSYGAYEALLADRDVDAVYIALPNALHTPWTIAAAWAGKHVLCEKPLARNAADAERMTAACRSSGVLLMEAFMWRHHPQHARVRSMLDSGAIGEPSLVRASFTFVIEPVLASGTNVRLRADLAGGSLMDVGGYAVNAARWLFAAEPVWVAGQQVMDPSYGVETAFAGMLRFRDDRLALIDGSFHHRLTNSYEVAGSGGRLLVDRAFRPDDLPGRIHILRGDDEYTERVAPADQFALEADHFARSVRAGRLLPPAEDGVAQARVIGALYTSAESGQAVRLD
jgi:predicted dehydrogenase